MPAALLPIALQGAAVLLTFGDGCGRCCGCPSPGEEEEEEEEG